MVCENFNASSGNSLLVLFTKMLNVQDKKYATIRTVSVKNFAQFRKSCCVIICAATKGKL